jgi:hypothetical protein
VNALPYARSLAVALVVSGCAVPPIAFENKVCSHLAPCPAGLTCAQPANLPAAVCLRQLDPLNPDGGAFDFADDFESGTLLLGDAPAGRWTNVYPPGPSTLVLSLVDGHQSERAFRLSDVTEATGEGSELHLYTEFPPRMGDLYVRLWMRVSNSNGKGVAALPEVYGTLLAKGTLLAVMFDGAAHELGVVGYDGLGIFREGPERARLADGWHQLAFSTVGLGTQGGVRSLLVDGSLVVAQSGIDWRGAQIDRLLIGEPFANDRSITGNFDFDDVRASSSPLALRWELATGAAPRQGQCAAATIRAVDATSFGRAESTPLTASLSSSGAQTGFFADAACLEPSAKVTLPAGYLARVLFFRTAAPGAVTLRIDGAGLMAAEQALEVSP